MRRDGAFYWVETSTKDRVVARWRANVYRSGGARRGAWEVPAEDSPLFDEEVRVLSTEVRPPGERPIDSGELAAVADRLDEDNAASDAAIVRAAVEELERLRVGLR